MNVQRKQALSRSRHPSGAVHQQSEVKGVVPEQYWPGTLMGVGVFVALVSCFTVAFWTLLPPYALFRGLLVLCFAGNLLPYIRSGLWLGMERLEWFLFNLLAVGPLLMSLLLWMNFLLHGPVQREDHTVAYVEQGRTMFIYTFQDGYLEEFPMARAIYRDPGDRLGSVITVSQAQGLFGIPVVLRKEIK